MTTGAPIYLISACTSGEEFVSAFRRYADRNGVVFVPIAEPLPAGSRGRFALTLVDGGVMVEGEAEIVSAARTPSVLYGRIGMTLKFVEPDEPSKTMLAELEKARLALKPPAPSVKPRPAHVPAEPRPKPPAPSGRVDAVNALAECVAIGDVGALRSDVDAIPPKVGAPKFTLPSIPGSGPVTGRPKTPSVPPIPTAKSIAPFDRPRAASVPPPIPGVAKPITPTTLGMAPITRQTAIAATPPVGSPTGATLGMPPPAPASFSTPPAPPKLPSGPTAIAPTTTLRDDPTTPTPLRIAAASHRQDPTAPAMPPRADKIDLNQTMRGPAPGVDLTTRPKFDMNETMRGTKPAPPPTPASPVARQPTPASPTPVIAPEAVGTDTGPAIIVSSPALDAPVPVEVAPPIVAKGAPKPAPDIDEPTDLTTLPVPPLAADGADARRTDVGSAVAPSGVTLLPDAPAVSEDDERDTSAMAAEEPTNPVDPLEVDELGATLLPLPKLPSSVLNATVEESTPSGDWTMTPGETGPTITPRVPDKALEKREIPKGPPTGDWMIALDPSRPDGWSEPSKVERSPMLDQPGPPVSAVSSDKPLDSEARPVPVAPRDNEPKVQIDPTLIEPLQPLQAVDSFDDDEPALPPPPSGSQPAMPMMGAVGLMPPAPSPMSTAPGMGPIPMTPARPNTGPVMQSPMAMQPMPGPMPGSFVTPPAGQPHLANASGPALAIPMDPNLPRGFAPGRMLTDAGTGFFRDTGDVPRLPPEDTSQVDIARQRKRTIVIIASAGAAVVLAVVLLIALGGGGSDDPKPDPAGDPMKPTPPPKQPSDLNTPPIEQTEPPKIRGGDSSAQAMVQPPKVDVDAGAAVTPESPPTDCDVEIVSNPPGAEVAIADSVVGTTPHNMTMPCGVETKIVLKKVRYMNATKTFTPKPGGKPVRVVLARTTFSVKVSSTPPGATITLGGKTVGVTPTTVKLPAFEASTLKIAKDGFALDTQRVTPKANNLAVHATLTRVGRGVPPKPPAPVPKKTAPKPR